MKEYLPIFYCKICKGKCCKALPAPYLPNEIIRIFGSLESAISSGKVAIDWWEGDEPLYFIRPKTKNSDELYDPSWGGECIYLSDNGCSLPRMERPKLCRVLKPVEGGKCKTPLKGKGNWTNAKYVSAILWKKFGIDLEKFKI